MRNLLPGLVAFLVWGSSSLFLYQRFFSHSPATRYSTAGFSPGAESGTRGLPASNRQGKESTGDPVPGSPKSTGTPGQPEDDVPAASIAKNLTSEKYPLTAQLARNDFHFPPDGSKPEIGLAAKALLDNLANQLKTQTNQDLRVVSRHTASETLGNSIKAILSTGEQAGLERANSLRTELAQRGILPSRIIVVLRQVTPEALEMDGYFHFSLTEETQFLPTTNKNEMPSIGENGDVVVITRNLDFAYGSSKLPSDQKTEQFFTRLAEYLNQHREKSVCITGHTCNISSSGFNEQLGAARASSVKVRLQEFGVVESRLKSETAGERKPVADNGSKEGQQANRRVEIMIR